MHLTPRILSIVGLFFLSALAIKSYYPSAEAKEDAKVKTEKAEKAPDHSLDLPMFDSILNGIKEVYVEPVTDDKLLKGALDGMLSALDPHSMYLDPKAYEELKDHTKGDFGGLGMEVTMENGFVKIISPIDDTPAQKADLQPGDLIVAIDKKPVSGMTLTEAVDLLRGKPGTKVKIYIKREGKDVFEKTLTRALIHVNAVKWRVENNMGYIRISTFNEDTVRLMKEAVEAIKKQEGNKLVGFVIDVRNNPGGLLDAAVGASNLFLNKGQEIVSTRGRVEKTNVKFDADASDIAKDIPIVVLINGGSASASEILAGALKDNHRALIVGTKSFGKGSVQVILPLTNGGAIKLTTARYYTPSGESIQAKGITPQIVVDQIFSKLEKVDENERIREQDFSGALDLKENETEEKPSKKDKKTTVPTAEDEKKKLEVKDYQLLIAFDILKTMSLTQKYEKNTTKSKLKPEAKKGKK